MSKVYLIAVTYAAYRVVEADSKDDALEKVKQSLDTLTMENLEPISQEVLDIEESSTNSNVQ